MSSPPPQPAGKLKPRRLDTTAPAMLTAQPHTQPQATDATATDPTIIANAGGTGSTAPLAPSVIDLAAIRTIAASAAPTTATVASLGPAVSGEAAASGALSGAAGCSEAAASGAAGCSGAAASGAAGAGPSSMNPRSFNWSVTKFPMALGPPTQQNRQSAGSDPMDTTSSMDTNSDHIASPDGNGS